MLGGGRYVVMSKMALKSSFRSMAGKRGISLEVHVKEDKERELSLKWLSQGTCTCTVNFSCV